MKYWMNLKKKIDKINRNNNNFKTAKPYISFGLTLARLCVFLKTYIE